MDGGTSAEAGLVPVTVWRGCGSVEHDTVSNEAIVATRIEQFRVIGPVPVSVEVTIAAVIWNGELVQFRPKRVAAKARLETGYQSTRFVFDFLSQLSQKLDGIDPARVPVAEVDGVRVVADRFHPQHAQRLSFGR